MSTHLTDQALEYLYEGFNPLPLWDNKAPMLKTGHPYLYDAVADKDVPKLFASAQKIGIACGAVSGNFEVIDFDAKDGEPITDIFNRFMADETVKAIVSNNDLPVFRTPSGGYHVYYRYEGRTYPAVTLAKWDTGKVMIETRGNGTYVAVFPSKGYVQIAGSEIVKIATISSDERGFLIAVAESMTQSLNIKNTSRRGVSDKKWPDKFDTSNPHGRFNEECSDAAKQLLVGAGWTYIETRRHDGVEYWERPGKSTDNKMSTSATWGKMHNMFYCWSDNAPPFEKETAYTPFDILMLLQFDGNFKDASAHVIKLFAPPPEAADDFLKVEPFIQPTPPPPPDEDEPIPARAKFPIEVFPSDVQRFIKELNRCLNFNEDFVSIAMMFTIATINGNKFKLKVKTGWTAPTIFWFAAVGEPGTMKSPPLSLIIDPLMKIDIASKKINDLAWEEQQHDHEQSKSKKLIKKPKFKQILINDTTLEAINEIHQFNRRGLGYYKDELVGFINSMNQYRKGSDEQFWLESFNNKSININRVSKDQAIVEDININIIGTIQPSVLTKLSRDYEGNGLTDRFLFTTEERKIYPMTLNDIDEQWLTWWNETIKNASAAMQYMDAQDKVVIDMQKEAQVALVGIDEGVCSFQESKEITANMKGYLSKRKTYLPRFVLLMAIFDYIFDGKELIATTDHVARADKIMDYFVKSAENISNESKELSEMKNIMDTMKTMNTKEKIIAMAKKGYKPVNIAKAADVSRAYVSMILSGKK